MSEMNTVEMTNNQVTPNDGIDGFASEFSPDAVPSASDINIGACATSGLLGGVCGFALAKIMDGNEEKKEAKEAKKAEKEAKREQKKAEREEKRFENYQKFGAFLGLKVERLPKDEDPKGNKK